MKTVSFTSQEMAEEFIPRPGWVIISIVDHHGEEANLQDGWTDILRLSFHDTDLTKEFSEETKQLIRDKYPPMCKEQADQIVAFVEKHANAPGLLVHCHAGISRSAAVAKWVMDRFGLSYTDHEMMCHNQWVYQLLDQASEE